MSAWQNENLVVLLRLTEAFPSVDPADVETVVRTNRFDFPRCCQELLSFFPTDCLDEQVRQVAEEMNGFVAPYANPIDGVFDNIMGPNYEEIQNAVDTVMHEKFGEIDNDLLRAHLLRLASKIYVNWVVEDKVPTNDVALEMALKLMHARVDPNPNPPKRVTNNCNNRPVRYSEASDRRRMSDEKYVPPDKNLRKFIWPSHFNAGRFVIEDCPSFSLYERAREVLERCASNDLINQKRARESMLRRRRDVELEVFRLNNGRRNGPWPLSEVLQTHINPASSEMCLHIDLHGLTTDHAVRTLFENLKRLYQQAVAVEGDTRRVRRPCCPLLIHCGAGNHSRDGRSPLARGVRRVICHSGVRWAGSHPKGVFVVDVLSCGKLS
ncbi:MAG: uncharacterized protein KVP18_000222 [Porospora cf. gigantea A]|uniref:uncharacterized protein n=1 Tax=Porospora cf. gigantea A TaxID=2853593 RepID=UPI00355A67CD|nr:MAG: hypothetical protein KVP18_000222 [Porospora cf. gigantea A]